MKNLPRQSSLLLLTALACANASSVSDGDSSDADSRGDDSTPDDSSSDGEDGTVGDGDGDGDTTGTGGNSYLDTDKEIPDPPIMSVCDETAPDCADPRCDGVGACEYSLEVSCADGVDNDNDGVLDCQDSDCSGRGFCEFSQETSCADAKDNDGDSLSDCDDPDCESLSVCEAYVRETSCRDSADNDGDGFSDCKDVNCNGLSGCEMGLEFSCGDGFDNDADGLSDCYDADCVGDSLCQVVNETRCADGIDNDANGASDCSDPQCSGGACQGTETTCTDGVDNDGDGLTDCADNNCSASCQVAGETSCGDGRDNDGDGATDCIDLSCGGRNSCEYGAETSCGDAKDNDGDGAGDCNDPDCFGVGVCAGERVGDCQDTSEPGCEATTEVTCNDGVDNDGDLTADCLDPDCAGQMGENFLCQPAGEAACGDGWDNDLDGLLDCSDPNCNGDTGPLGKLCETGVEKSCAEAGDNDADSLIDCDDADCDGRQGPDYVCNYRFETSCTDGENNDADSSGADCLDLDCVDTDQRGDASCPSGAPNGDCRCEFETETDCDDGFDNDKNGQTDCEDDACASTATCTGGSGGGGSGGGSGGGDPVGFCEGGPLIVDDAGTDRCSGDVAATAFRFALCAGEVTPNKSITTDSFSSALGSYGGSNVGTEGSVGVNGTANMNGNALNVGGSLWFGGSNILTTGTNTVAVNAYAYSGWNSVGTTTVAGDAYLSGTIGSGLTVGGTRYNGFDFSGYPNPPCDGVGGVTFNVATMITAVSSSNDNATETSDITALQSTNTANVTLECGKYYLTRMTGNGKTIHLNGPVALFVDGQVQLSDLTITLAEGASLDLFIKDGFGISSNMNVGDPAKPWLSRIYVHQSTVNLQSASNFSGNLYAPNSDYTTGGQNQVFYGALLVKKVNTNGTLTIHYDTEILNAGDACVPTPPPPGTHACNSCRDCANQGCYDGADVDNLRECSGCRTSADCCAPLVCNQNACVAPGSF